MIPATSSVTSDPVPAVTYDQWVPVGLSGYRADPGAFAMSVRLHRCRTLEDGTTELHPDPTHGLEIAVPDINAPASAEYPAPVRAAVQQAAAAILAAAYAVGTARGVL